MKMLCALLGASLLSFTGLSADQPTRRNCDCDECHCTKDNHCGCMDEYNNPHANYACDKGCGCGKKGDKPSK